MNKHKSTNAIKLLRTHSLPSLVQDQLETMILDGKLMPGSQLTEIPLAAQLGISRGPVREAFRGLEEKGLVRIEKNRGVFVRTISFDEAEEMYELRFALEELIAKRLARRPEVLASAGLPELLDRTEKLARKSDFAGCHTANMMFHDRLAELAGNATLLDAYRRLVGELSLFRRQAHARIRDASSLFASLEDHRAILAALTAGDARTASRLLRKHLAASQKRLQQLFVPADTPVG